MTTSDTMSTNCPSEETLAAFIDGRLPAEERREVTAHLVDCASCRDTVLIADEFGASGDAAASATVVRGSFGRRWGPPLIAVAAALVVVFSLPAVRQRLTGGDLSTLVAASKDLPYRSIEGRLSGGFAHKAVRSAKRGGKTEGTVDAEIARHRFELAASRVARKTGDPHARGVAHLLLGDYDAAIRALEEAARKRPADAAIVSDLSLAYAARSSALGKAADLATALSTAERAWVLQKSPETAWNRAVILSKSADRSAALRAWDDFLSIADDQAWWDEAVLKKTRVQEGL